jgi:hypothetical protein
VERLQRCSPARHPKPPSETALNAAFAMVRANDEPDDGALEQILCAYCDAADPERASQILLELQESTEEPADRVQRIAERWRRSGDPHTERAEELADALDDPDQREIDKCFYRSDRAVRRGESMRATKYAERACAAVEKKHRRAPSLVLVSVSTILAGPATRARRSRGASPRRRGSRRSGAGSRARSPGDDDPEPEPPSDLSGSRRPIRKEGGR